MKKIVNQIQNCGPVPEKSQKIPVWCVSSLPGPDGVKIRSEVSQINFLKVDMTNSIEP